MLAKLQRRVARNAAAETTSNADLALEAAQKVEREFTCIAVLCKNAFSRRLQFLQQSASQRLP